MSPVLAFNLGNSVVQLLNAVFHIWNVIINEAYKMLLKTPGSINGVSSVLNEVNTIFVGVGTSLVVLFFVIGFCQETVNIRDEMRYESIIRYLIRLCMAEYFTINSKTVLMSIVKCCKIFSLQLKAYFNTGTAKLSLTEADKAIIKDCNFGESIVLLIIGIIVTFLIGIMAISILYTTFSRMLKLIVLIPFGSLAFSTMGGGGEVGRVCVTYLKYFIAVALECVTISTALIFGTALMKYGGLDFGMSGWKAVLGHLVSILFQAAILAGTVKGAEHISREMIGH